MKKLLTLLLALMMIVPGALCEQPTATPPASAFADRLDYELDMEDFTIKVNLDDGFQKYDKADAKTWAVLYPEYYPEEVAHSAITIVWQQRDLNEMLQYGALDKLVEYAQTLAYTQLEKKEYTLGHKQLEFTKFAPGQLTVTFHVDVSKVEEDGQTRESTYWYRMRFFMQGSAGTYTMMIQTTSEQKRDNYTEYLDSVVFKDAN